jgi:hypothetical protein
MFTERLKPRSSGSMRGERFLVSLARARNTGTAFEAGPSLRFPSCVRAGRMTALLWDEEVFTGLRALQDVDGAGGD